MKRGQPGYWGRPSLTQSGVWIRLRRTGMAKLLASLLKSRTPPKRIDSPTACLFPSSPQHAAGRRSGCSDGLSHTAAEDDRPVSLSSWILMLLFLLPLASAGTDSCRPVSPRYLIFFKFSHVVLQILVVFEWILFYVMHLVAPIVFAM
jgi:hypothetical protein